MPLLTRPLPSLEAGGGLKESNAVGHSRMMLGGAGEEACPLSPVRGLPARRGGRGSPLTVAGVRKGLFLQGLYVIIPKLDFLKWNCSNSENG